MAYSKIKLSEQLVEDGIGEDVDLTTQINEYFPTQLTKHFGGLMASHPLIQEIIAGHVTNNLGNRMGPTFTTYVQEETSASALNVVRAYMAAEDIFGISELWNAINDLDFIVSNSVLNDLLIQIQGLVERTTLWLLRNTRDNMSIQRLKDTYKPGVEVIRANMQAILTESSQSHLADMAAKLVEQNIPADVAERLSSLHYLFYGLDIIRVATNTGTEVLDVAQTYFALEMDLELHWLRNKVSALTADDMWQRRAKGGLGDEIDNSLRTLTQEVIQSSADIKKLEERLSHWRESNSDSVHHYHTTFNEIKAESDLSLAMVTVAIRELRNLM